MADSAGLPRVFQDFATTICELETYEIEDILGQLTESALRVIPAHGAAVLVRQNGHARLVAATPAEITDLERLQETLHVGPSAEVTATGRTVIEHDLVASHDRWPGYDGRAAALGLRSVAALPLRARGRIWATLDLYRETPGGFSVEELRTARAIADLATSYVVLAQDREAARRAQEQLAHMAMHDQLTGLPNRALLLDRLTHALAAARRRGSAVAVLFLDLNGFKEINDTLGHSAGDLVLCEVALRLSTVLRGKDTLARLGGDEFVLVCDDLPHADTRTTAVAVYAVAERIRACLAEPISSGGAAVHVSASIGVALAHPEKDRAMPDPTTLLREADADMYREKGLARVEPLIRTASLG